MKKAENKELLKKDFNILIHFFKLAHKISKTYIPILLFSAVFKGAVPFINVIMPKYIIDELIGLKRVDVLAKYVIFTIIINFILSMVNRFFDNVVKVKNEEIMAGFDLLIGEKIVNMDFEKIEDPEILDLKERAIFPIKNQGAIWNIVNRFVNCVTNIITILGLIGIILTLNVIVILLVICGVSVTVCIFKKIQKYAYEFYQKLIPCNRKFGYYANMTSDFSYGKDIRLYNMSSLIMDKIKKFNDESIEYFGKMFSIQGKLEGINAVILQIQMVVVYGYITYKVFNNSISIGDFTMYTAAAISFGNSIAKFLMDYNEVRQMCRYLENYMEFESIESSRRLYGKKINKEDKYEIEFKNVYFKYPRAKDYTLKNISIKINSGEKLSIVGFNGSGKTTFIKLLTRLYEPTKGEILLNNVNINEYDYDEYMKILSVVFQDYKLLAFSVKENIALDKYKEVKDKDIENTLEEVGLADDFKKLKNGVNTSIYKTFDKEGIEFSGGQSQKLAMARAIYKDAPIVVLDEPTAALDPKAEYEIYNRFNELVGGKTTIYISHRLSSCRFCDKIAVFNKGEIVQYGTHDELIKEEGNEYEVMYSAQAQYYV